MSASTELNVFLVALIGGLVSLVPAAIAVARVYLQVLENRARINNRPTVDQMHEAINNKARELGLNGVQDRDTTSTASESRTVNASPGSPRRRFTPLPRNPGADPPDDDQRA